MMAQDRLHSIQRHLGRVLPYVDRAIVVDNGSTDGSREWLRTQPKVITIEREWNDSFVEARNAYLRVADELADDSTLLAVADDDELYSEQLLKDLRELGRQAYDLDYNIVRVRSQSVETDWKGDIHWSHLDEWHKPLLFVWEPRMEYYGVNQSQVHEDIRIPSGKRHLVLDWQDKYYYCISPETRILCDDLVWRTADSIRLGQTLIGFDEAKPKHGQGTKLRRSSLSNKLAMEANCVEIITTRGKVVCSDNHWWWAKQKRDFGWVISRQLKIGDEIGFLVEPWDEQQSHSE
jgi:glycosyltransferase involved in cell wall biosynthesis